MDHSIASGSVQRTTRLSQMIRRDALKADERHPEEFKHTQLEVEYMAIADNHDETFTSYIVPSMDWRCPLKQ
eukprot:2092654-Pleurochrysis_carterae.AAC.1